MLSPLEEAQIPFGYTESILVSATSRGTSFGHESGITILYGQYDIIQYTFPLRRGLLKPHYEFINSHAVYLCRCDTSITSVSMVQWLARREHSRGCTQPLPRRRSGPRLNLHPRRPGGLLGVT
ncbi:hypothetical protein EVAR_75089_1 [Eumeta japonica]|uniref:Uncharacterized protein n=1 Tax=Eumeta variegata TaxID=151549 RepID=A0A4C1W253_EUMVA|nr:hypothetical protein EVAR_75089_1 [Eumeta japonica]